MQQTIQLLMFASNLRNEFAIVILGYSGITKNFLLNNSDISIPTLGCILRQSVQDFVSIVSIQADQSRLMGGSYIFRDEAKFQSYQFRQINPDQSGSRLANRGNLVSIVSIQADQSRRGK